MSRFFGSYNPPANPAPGDCWRNTKTKLIYVLNFDNQWEPLLDVLRRRVVDSNVPVLQENIRYLQNELRRLKGIS